MTTLFGSICNQPKRTALALEEVRDELVVEEPVPRWGLAYVDAGQVLLTKQPRLSEGGVDFYAQLSRLQSDYVVGWRASSDGLRSATNTQPFRFRKWIYAQEVSERPEDAKLLGHMPNFLRRSVKGNTTAEQCFHLFLAFLHDAGTLGHPHLTPAQIVDALDSTIATIERTSKRSAREVLGNIVVANSRHMVAARLAGPLYIRHLRELDPRRLDSERYRAVLVLSKAEKPGKGFEEVPVNSVVAVHRDLVTDIRSLASQSQ